jgi:hypothetical protein
MYSIAVSHDLDIDTLFASALETDDLESPTQIEAWTLDDFSDIVSGSLS